MMLDDREVEKVSIDGRDFPQIYRAYREFKRETD